MVYIVSELNVTVHTRCDVMLRLGAKVSGVLKDCGAFIFSVRQFLQEDTAVLQNVRDRSHMDSVTPQKI
jgi:hypothetical protein